MKKIISAVFAFIISASLFAQTSGTTQQATKGKTRSSSPSQIAVSDPGVPNKRMANTSTTPVKSKPKKTGKLKGKKVPLKFNNKLGKK